MSTETKNMLDKQVAGHARAEAEDLPACVR